MHCHPPDVLITNVSMLGAMLNREVDDALFDTTRTWLTSNDDAYFYLVLDELHLQRGAAGTEVSYLLRLLLHRLGLSDPRHRHKVRILASSASLPVDGADGQRSCAYLWDMFGSFGTCTAQGRRAIGHDDWANAIVPGEPEPEHPLCAHRLDAQPFVDFLKVYGGRDSEPACSGSSRPVIHEESWRSVSAALGLHDAPDIHDVVKAAIEEAGRRLAAACWSDDDGRPRAMPLDELSSRLFEPKQTDHNALRGLLLVRGLGDVFQSWFTRDIPQAAYQ
jgi:hypothetical protein